MATLRLGRATVAPSVAHAVSDFYSGAMPVLIFVAAQRAGLPAWTQGLAAALWYTTSSVLQPLFGIAVDRTRAWWLLPAAVLATTLGISAIGIAPTFGVALALVVAAGIGSALLHPEGGRIASSVADAERPASISIFQVAGQLGYGLGPVVAASLVAAGGLARTPALALVGIAGAALLAIDFATHGVAHRTERRDAGHVRQDGDRRAIALVVAATAVKQVVASSFVFYLPNLFVARGFGVGAAGAVVSAYLIAATAGLLAGGRFLHRVGPLRLSAIALVASVPFLVAGIVAPLPLAIPSLLAGSALLAVQQTPGVIVLQRILGGRAGLSLGLINGVAFGLGSLAVLGSGVAVERAGVVPSLVALCVLPVVAAAAFAGVAPALRRRNDAV